MNKKRIHIKGMHCKSCEILVAEELSQISNIEKTEIHHQTGIADIYYKKNLDEAAVSRAIQNAGYSLGKNEYTPWFSTSLNDYTEIVLTAIILTVLYYIVSDIGILNTLSISSNNLASLPVVFMIGLVAGVSTCAALVGGLVLSVSARYAKMHPEMKPGQKFTPHIYFNIGRIGGFFLLGGVIGLIGSFFQISLQMTGLFTLVIAILMFVFGLQLTGLFPRLSGWNLTLPSGLYRMLGISSYRDNTYGHLNTMVLGALTFFLPCGFTQLIQLYAMGTGNPLVSAFTMGVFALGTTPGLLGIGGLTSLVKGDYAKPFFRFAGLVIIALGIFNLSNGLTLSGLVSASSSANGENTAQIAENVNGKQIIKATYTNKNDLVPNTFRVAAGKPVRFEVDVQDDGYGCMGSMALPGLSEKIALLKKGVPMVFEFTPNKTGNYTIACAMGVPRGSISVN